MLVLITGGAGFIGRQLASNLLNRGDSVRVFDNLSSGSKKNISDLMDQPGFEFYYGDLSAPSEIIEAVRGCNVVYHLAANPEVRSQLAGPKDHFRQNVEGTFNLLEAVREVGDIDLLVFTSTSTVYGDATQVPTPETYAPLKPISTYGASKLAGEAMICSYAFMYGFRCVLFRMANIVGPNIGHGVIYDFVEKLRRDPSRLEVLGDGTQSKSYLYIDDCIGGMILGAEASKEKVEILNIGSEDRITVLTIAELVKDEMGLLDAYIDLTGGVNGGRGWRGDVKTMQLDMTRLRNLGWEPKYGSAEAVRKTARARVHTMKPRPH